MKYENKDKDVLEVLLPANMNSLQNQKTETLRLYFASLLADQRELCKEIVSVRLELYQRDLKEQEFDYYLRTGRFPE